MRVHVGLCLILPLVLLSSSDAMPCHAEEAIPLASARRPGDLLRVELIYEAEGQLRTQDGDKVQSQPMKVNAQISYDERWLALDPEVSGLRHSARYYDHVEAGIEVENAPPAPQLGPARRLIVAHIADGQTAIFCPEAPLTREELELVSVPASSLVADDLLPSESIELKKTWAIPDTTICALLGVDAVGTSDVRCKLTEVTEDSARMQIAGTVQAAIDGVSADLELKGKFKFDRQLGRVTWVALLIKEQRSIGHVSAGVECVTRLQMKISPLETSEKLKPEYLSGLELSPTAENMLLCYDVPDRSMRFRYDRNWHVINDEAQLLVLRRVDRGELLGQCNISPLSKVAPDQAPSLSHFQEEVRRGLGDQFGQFLEASEATLSTGYLRYTVVATGTVAELPITWSYYLLVAPDGSQAAIACTTESELVERFNHAERPLVDGIELFERSTPTAAAARVKAAAR